MASDAPQYTVQRLDYHPAMKLANIISGILNAIGFHIGRLDQQQILDRAQRRTGLSDWGSEDFMEPMEKIVNLMRGAEFTEFAKIFARQSLITACANRLRIQDYIKRHPEVAEIPVERPIFILGFPRTGTTLLQNLISLEDSARALQFWELISPIPLSDDPTIDFANRQRSARAILKAAMLVAPEQKFVHEARWDTAEECWPLFTSTFAVMNYDLQSGFTEFGEWLMQHDMTGPYSHYRRQLQILAHQQPTDRFLLKCPEHLWFLDALLAVFPDACIVWTHRDPLDSVASYCSMMSMNYRTFYGRFDPKFIGSHITDRFQIGVTRAMAARERASEANFFDVDFNDLVQDPVAMVRKIKNYFDLPHAPDGDEQIADYLGNDRADKKGKHVYAAERYGLDPVHIRAKYGDYIDRFDIPLRSS